MFKALYILDAAAMPKIYGPDECRDIGQLVHVYAAPHTQQSIRQNLSLLADADIIFSGWGGPKLDQAFLDATPRLKAVFYGAGSVRNMVTDAFWNRNIVLSSAWAANAIPVAEFAFAQILFSLKRGWHYILGAQRGHRHLPKEPVPGAYRSTVGILSLGMTGQETCRLLRQTDVRVIAFDPFVTADVAQELGVTLCSLDEVFCTADVVSLHTPLLKKTEGMITGAHFTMMKKNATFINTARGAIVREEEMIAVLRQRHDLWALLDVTHPEPPATDSPLWSLPNVVLTPHIAGSLDNECRRMGRYMVQELERFMRSEPLHWRVTRERAATMA